MCIRDRAGILSIISTGPAVVLADGRDSDRSMGHPFVRSDGLERQDEENAAMAESGTPSKDHSDLQSLPLYERETKLGAPAETGLTKGEAEQSLAQYGPNEIAEKT